MNGRQRSVVAFIWDGIPKKYSGKLSITISAALIDLFVDILHVVLDDALSGSSAPAGETAQAGLDVLLVEVYLLNLCVSGESLQKRLCDVQGIAALCLGASVQY